MDRIGAAGAVITGRRTAEEVDHWGGDHGARAGVLDEVQIHQIPVLFGGGRRLFDVLPARIELKILEVIDTPEATHIRYRVLR
ncbi:dihydrofolate reductase family protein [Amycolatopsis sp. ATCC 39116]|uniref:dihydrofolate reductase family protein n=1 Tax=Amycolatopsis sp. (strain ATCC 39116 / 75iv2) TaxID=385957 RepID=UPI000262860F|nr:dihydrofolate reductase family protein [Amycolatopsis sp. ATCC 39116]